MSLLTCMASTWTWSRHLWFAHLRTCCCRCSTSERGWSVATHAGICLRVALSSDLAPVRCHIKFTFRTASTNQPWHTQSRSFGALASCHLTNTDSCTSMWLVFVLSCRGWCVTLWLHPPRTPRVPTTHPVEGLYEWSNITCSDDIIGLERDAKAPVPLTPKEQARVASMGVDASIFSLYDA